MISTSQAIAEPQANQIKLVALDLDGTLLRSDKRLSKRAVEAIRETRRRGVRVVIASARPPRSVREIYEHLELDDVQVNYNGALIYDQLRRRNLYHRPLEANLVKRIVKVARRADRKLVVSVEILDKWYTDHFDESLPTETSLKFFPDFVGPLESFVHIPATKLLLLAPPKRLEKVTKTIHAKFGPMIGMAVSDKHLLQIVHPRVDKGRAISKIARKYGVARQQVMAIGDAPNDRQMLKWAGLGVAVENAWPTVREAADVIVPSNDDDGVVVALEKFVLDARSG